MLFSVTKMTETQLAENKKLESIKNHFDQAQSFHRHIKRRKEAANSKISFERKADCHQLWTTIEFRIQTYLFGKN